MSRALAVVLAAGAGCLVGIQAPVNARLAQAIGRIPAATFSFVVGTVALVAILAFAGGGFGSFAHLGRAPWWALLGGLLGGIFVVVALTTVKTLGASGLTAAVIAGQLAISLVIDRFGLLGIARAPVGASRIVGLVLLVAGVVLVVRR